MVLPVKRREKKGKKCNFQYIVPSTAGSSALVLQCCGQIDNINITEMSLGFGGIQQLILSNTNGRN